MRRQVAVLAFLLVAARAAAVEYEVPIDIDTDDDLYELLTTEQISEDTFNALLDLYQRGVDLNEADAEEMYALPGLTQKDSQAIVSYRAQAGNINDARALVTAGVLTEEKLRRITPFLATRPSGGSPLAASGRVHIETIRSSEDSGAPPVFFSARVQTLRHLTLGVAVLLDRTYPTDIRWDPNRLALSGAPPGTTANLAKLYADWKTPSYQVILGSFRAGFGLQLVFDNTSLYTPNGIYHDEVIIRHTDLVRGCDESAGELPVTPCPSPIAYVTPDYKVREGMFGVAAMLRQLETDVGWLQLTGWVSRQEHAIYQYQLYDKGTCSDPNNDSDPGCAAPTVFRRQPDVTAPTSNYAFKTLPEMWVEPMAGGNATFFFNRRTHIGLTGYGAKPDFLVNGVDLSFQEWARFPYGGGYGAFGADAAWGVDNVDLGVEVARSFDGEAAGGGYGAIARGTVTWPKNELEISLRYYDENFVNPYAGSIAEPDQVDGQRARDEAGARVRFGGRVTPHLELHGLADFWMQPSTNTPKIRVEARGDYFFNSATEIGLYTRWQDKDLTLGGFGQCYLATTDTTPDGQPIPCAGQKIDVGALFRVPLASRLSLAAEYLHRFVDDPTHPDDFMQQSWGWVTLSWFPTSALHFYARSRYMILDLTDSTDAERSIWSYVEASWKAGYGLLLQLRYDNRYFFDDRVSTATRIPNPEHWLRLLVESRF